MRSSRMHGHSRTSMHRHRHAPSHHRCHHILLKEHHLLHASKSTSMRHHVHLFNVHECRIHRWKIETSVCAVSHNTRTRMLAQIHYTAFSVPHSYEMTVSRRFVPSELRLCSKSFNLRISCTKENNLHGAKEHNQGESKTSNVPSKITLRFLNASSSSLAEVMPASFNFALPLFVNNPPLLALPVEDSCAL